MKTAAAWRRFYADERARLGERGLIEALESAPDVPLPPRGALVFPHTKLAVSAPLVGAVARAVVRAGADAVLAVGVLHGAREEDAALVERARGARGAQGGDGAAIAALRRVHGDGVPGDERRWTEEFSLDGFVAMLAVAARREGTEPPRVFARYPFLVGDDPASLPLADELSRLAERMPIVATTDPIHHGAGYGTPEADRRPREDEATAAWARAKITEQIDALARGEWTRFAALAADVRSDFRDAGPVLAHLLRARGSVRPEILALDLVDYADTLAALSPTWVAAPLIALHVAPLP